MKLLTKFESKLSRAKGVAFHPVRPWVLVSLASLTIQLWDYRMGTLIDRFEGHTGPVRLVDFHPTQPLFVSGGDDYAVKVWSLTSRKCIFTLQGHLDYVRTVSFHHDLPWILSCSDDQTIRIWNWQNRLEIACLTGHNHYVMLALFHPSKDLLLLASLDQTVRVWDISGLRKKHSAPSAARPYDEQPLPQQDIFGNVNAVVKFVLEGHDKGVNWAAFHPTQPLIVSAGDDRVAKLWRMTDHNAWEVDSFRGHTGNVLCAVFHPHQDVVISVLDDKTMRVWDVNTRSPIKQFRREHDRIYLVACHPHMNLFASCHDSGIMVFKLERERPAHAVVQNRLLYVDSNKELHLLDFADPHTAPPLLLLKRIGKPWTFMRSLLYNPTDSSVVLVHGDNAQSKYELVSLPKHAAGAIEPTSTLLGEANAAFFISRNRFVTFVTATHTLCVKDMSNSTTKTIQLDLLVTDMLYAGPGRVFLVKLSSVVCYDVQQRKHLAELLVNNVKYAVWLHDASHVALLSKHTITIATKDLELVTAMHETIRIKSAAWDDLGVLLYSTLNHIKYTLLNGDNGIIKTVENTIYICKVEGPVVYVLTREGTVSKITIDPTEYRFKKLLVNRNFGEVLRIIRGSNLVGQNIIGYLQKKGYPEIALQFVEDPETRFDLALECGNLNVALDMAKQLNEPVVWDRLAQEALVYGNLEVVEYAYQQRHLFDKLSFVYLIKGDTERLSKMTAIAEHRGDVSALVQNTFYDNDVRKRVEALFSAGMLPLAFTLAKTHNFDDLAAEILAQAGISELDVELPSNVGKPIPLPQPLEHRTTNWPLKELQVLFFESAMINGTTPEISEEGTRSLAPESAVAFDNAEFDIDADIDIGSDNHDEGAWDLDDDLHLEDLAITAKDEVSGPDGEVAVWLSNAKVPATLVAAGAFDQAASLLSKQVGVVEFKPLRDRFMQVYLSSKLYLPGVPGLPAMRAHVREDDDEEVPVPFVPGYDQLDEELAVGFKHFKANNLEAAIAQFRKIIYTVTVSVVHDEEQSAKCASVLTMCREYILGLLIELERRSVPAENVRRNLELAAYFTRAQLQKPHRMNALQVAMTQLFRHQNYQSALYFAQQLLEIVATGPRAEQAAKIKAKADSVATDNVEYDFDPFAEFEICAASHTPIYAGEPSVAEKLVGAKYRPEHRGEICRITQITAIGATASGLRLCQ